MGIRLVRMRSSGDPNTVPFRVQVISIPLGHGLVFSSTADVPTPCVPFILTVSVTMLWGPGVFDLTGAFIPRGGQSLWVFYVATSRTLHTLQFTSGVPRQYHNSLCVSLSQKSREETVPGVTRRRVEKCLWQGPLRA